MQFIYSGITSGSIFALVALGFNIIYNTTGIINFAQGEFVMIGGMLIYTLLSIYGIPLFMAVPVALLLALIIGILFDKIFIKLVKVPNEINLITVTIAAATIIRGLAMVIWGRNTLNVSGYIPYSVISFPGGSLTSNSLLVIAVSLLTAFSLSLFFKKSSLGKAFRACYNDKMAASICGVDVGHIRMLAFGIAAFLGVVAGIVTAPITYVTYTDGVMVGLKGFAAAILGGLGNFWGGVAGGLLLGIFEGFFASILPSGYKDAFAFLIILFVLFLRPMGLFGKKKAERL
jgi:branched-chain amino acid transport system permease protein